MVLQNKKAGIFTVKVGVGGYFDMEENDLFIILREPTAEEALSFKEIANKENQNVDEKRMFELMPQMIVEHNFEQEPGKKMATDEVWSLIMQRAACATEVVTKWSNNLPLANRKLEK